MCVSVCIILIKWAMVIINWAQYLFFEKYYIKNDKRIKKKRIRSHAHIICSLVITKKSKNLFLSILSPFFLLFGKKCPLHILLIFCVKKVSYTHIIIGYKNRRFKCQKRFMLLVFSKKSFSKPTWGVPTRKGASIGFFQIK